MAGMHVCWVLKKPMNQLLNKFLPVPIPPAQQAPELSRGIRLFFFRNCTASSNSQKSTGNTLEV